MNNDPESQRIQGQPPEEAPESSPAFDALESPRCRPPIVTPNSPGSLIQGGSIRLFRVAGIDVLLHWSWFFFALLDFQSNGSNQSFGFARYQSQAWYLVEYLSLFGIVLLHEFGHVLACRSVGGIANRIVLWPLGGIAFVDPPARPGALLWSIAAGPLVNAVLLAPTFGLYFLCRAVGWQYTAPDVCRFALALASINAYLLLFNLLPVFPLDGGRIVQALLWFIVGRAGSLLAAAVIGLLATLGLLVFAIVEQSLTWGIMAAFGLLFSLVGVSSAFALRRMLNAPRREMEYCPSCGAAPPIGNFWPCPRCRVTFDAFAAGGKCPSCGTSLAAILCPGCGRSRPYREWYAEAVPVEALGEEPLAAALPPESAPPQPTQAARPATVGQRILCGAIIAFAALALCGLPTAGKQPWNLLIWPAGGAILGGRQRRVFDQKLEGQPGSEEVARRLAVSRRGRAAGPGRRGGAATADLEPPHVRGAGRQAARRAWNVLDRRADRTGRD